MLTGRSGSSEIVAGFNPVYTGNSHKTLGIKKLMEEAPKQVPGT